MKNVKKIREKYRVYCIINNLAESNQGFKGYVSDQKKNTGKDKRSKKKKRTKSRVETP